MCIYIYRERERKSRCILNRPVLQKRSRQTFHLASFHPKGVSTVLNKPPKPTRSNPVF